MSLLVWQWHVMVVPSCQDRVIVQRLFGYVSRQVDDCHRCCLLSSLTWSIGVTDQLYLLNFLTHDCSGYKYGGCQRWYVGQYRKEDIFSLACKEATECISVTY